MDGYYIIYIENNIVYVPGVWERGNIHFHLLYNSFGKKAPVEKKFALYMCLTWLTKQVEIL